MPVIVPEAAWELWLDPGLEDRAELQGLFEPTDEVALRVWPVSPLVNNVRNDGPELIAPLVADSMDLQPGLFDEAAGT